MDKMRRAQLIVPFGVGAIVNLPNDSVIIPSIDTWDSESVITKLHDQRLERRLKVNYFGTPNSGKVNPKGIKCYRFPKWLRCPNCYKSNLMPLKDWKAEWERSMRSFFNKNICYKCKSTLIPSRFIVACEHGHLDDFPWDEWVHTLTGGVKVECNSPNLTYLSTGASSALSGILIKCESCNSKKSMGSAFNSSIFEELNIKCSGNKPWIRKYDTCDLYPKTLQRGASNVYFPKVISSIIIPPYSDDVFNKVTKTATWKAITGQKGALDENEIKLLLGMIARELNIELSKVEKVYKKYYEVSDIDETKQSDEEYKYDEYKAFNGETLTIEQRSSKQFTIKELDGAQYAIKGIEKVVLAERIREIRVLAAFSRIKPAEISNEVEENASTVSSTLVSVKDDPTIDWLPGVEVNGEGIFLFFEMDTIKKWSENNYIKARAGAINENYVKVCERMQKVPHEINPAFIMLHTFSHLLIRELSLECGYSNTSLKERIYWGNQGASPMAGIFIYTASGDSEGSLGGLVEKGYPENLPDIIKNAISKASWCSSDPVCIESKGQGLDSLNLAACYTCTLLSETSCEEGNKFLDRVMLIGDTEHPDVGFFKI